MAQMNSTSLLSPAVKRKQPPGENDAEVSVSVPQTKKKQRVGPSLGHIPTTLPSQPHDEILTELRGKYAVLKLSVISSTSINKRVQGVLDHVGRFSNTDMSIVPGVVLLQARAGDANKLVTVIELARRQIGEHEQKWFQYNRVYEVAEEARNQRPTDQSVIEETIMDRQRDDGIDEDDDAFETMTTPTVFERAVQPPSKPATQLYMSIFLSRVPIPELQSKDFITTQSNSNQIEALYKKRAGLL